jgi:phosphoribosylcarboxyaminoimidazole (NCAIR) mutase
VRGTSFGLENRISSRSSSPVLCVPLSRRLKSLGGLMVVLGV